MPFKSVSPRPVKRRRKKGRYLKPPNKGGEKRYPANPGNVIQYPQKQSLRLTFFFRVSTMGICDVKEIKEPQEPAVRPHAGAGWSKHKGASECLSRRNPTSLDSAPRPPSPSFTTSSCPSSLLSSLCLRSVCVSVSFLISTLSQDWVFLTVTFCVGLLLPYCTGVFSYSTASKPRFSLSSAS